MRWLSLIVIAGCNVGIGGAAFFERGDGGADGAAGISPPVDGAIVAELGDGAPSETVGLADAEPADAQTIADALDVRDVQHEDVAQGVDAQGETGPTGEACAPPTNAGGSCPSGMVLVELASGGVYTSTRCVRTPCGCGEPASSCACLAAAGVCGPGWLSGYCSPGSYAITCTPGASDAAE